MYMEFSGYSDILSQEQRLLLNVIKVTTVNKNGLKWAKQNIKEAHTFLWPDGQKSLGQRPNPSTGARS